MNEQTAPSGTMWAIPHDGPDTPNVILVGDSSYPRLWDTEAGVVDLDAVLEALSHGEADAMPRVASIQAYYQHAGDKKMRTAAWLKRERDLNALAMAFHGRAIEAAFWLGQGDPAKKAALLRAALTASPEHLGPAAPLSADERERLSSDDRLTADALEMLRFLVECFEAGADIWWDWDDWRIAVSNDIEDHLSPQQQDSLWRLLTVYMESLTENDDH